MSSRKTPSYYSNSREKRLSSRREGSIFWIFFRIKQIMRWKSRSFNEQEDILSCKQSAASEWRKELLSSDIYLSGNFSLFVYCMTEILLVLALSRLLIMSDSQTSSIVVPNHCYKPDPSPVCSKAQQPRRPPAALRRFIGFCSSSYCTEMGIFSQLIKFSFRWWCLNVLFWLLTRNRMIPQHRSLFFFHLFHRGLEVGLGRW